MNSWYEFLRRVIDFVNPEDIVREDEAMTNSVLSLLRFNLLLIIYF